MRASEALQEHGEKVADRHHRGRGGDHGHDGGQCHGGGEIHNLE